MQLDIFDNSRDVMLRNDAADALERRDASAARQACDALSREYPADDSLPSLRVLTAYIEAADIGRDDAFRDHASLREARQMLDETIRDAAQRTFGDRAAPVWLAVSWQDLARRAVSLAFDARDPQDHAAPIWLRAGNWEAAVQAVATIESWRRKPAPLAWMAEARLHLLGLQATWPLLAELGVAVASAAGEGRAPFARSAPAAVDTQLRGEVRRDLPRRQGDCRPELVCGLGAH